MFVFKALVAVFSMTCMSFVHAESVSNLIVLNDVQSGKWTFVSDGTANSKQFPKSTETLCVTREQIIKNFNGGLYTNTITGAEVIPTILVKNTPDIGIAEVVIPAQQVGSISMPSHTINFTIKRVQKNKWVMSMGSSSSNEKLSSTATFLGGKSATCDPEKEQGNSDEDEIASNPRKPTTVGGGSIGSKGKNPDQTNPKDKPPADDADQNSDCNGTYKGTYQGFLAGNLKVSIYSAPDKKRQFLNGTASSTLKDEIGRASCRERVCYAV